MDAVVGSVNRKGEMPDGGGIDVSGIGYEVVGWNADGSDGDVAEPGGVEDLDGDGGGGGGEESVVDLEDEAVVPSGVDVAMVVDPGGEFLVRVDPGHGVGSERLGDRGEVLGGEDDDLEQL